MMFPRDKDFIVSREKLYYEANKNNLILNTIFTDISATVILIYGLSIQSSNRITHCCAKKLQFTTIVTGFRLRINCHGWSINSRSCLNEK